jgi:glycerophosphoryl diester phosphodiesterase
MLKIGHRGAMGYESENTLLSFQKAIDLGANMVELDVHLKNGDLFVLHDIEKWNNATPTLKQVFELVNKKIQINVELKGENTAQPTVEIIKHYILEKSWKEDLFFVSSFNYGELKKFKELMPEIRVGFLIERPAQECLRLCKEINAWSLNLSYKHINQKLVDDVHSNSLKILVYTVNKLKNIQEMKSLEVDGIISDFPDRI